MKKIFTPVLASIISISLLSSCSIPFGMRGPDMGGNKKSGVWSGMTTTSTTTATTNPGVVPITTCSLSDNTAQLLCLIDAFKSQLNTEQLATLQHSYWVEDAARWSNLPQALVQSNSKRIGLNFGSMTPIQIQYAKAIIQNITGTGINEGWDEVQQIINADEYLLANGGWNDYGASNYYIALLWAPGNTGTWELQFGGHHLAIANTYTDGKLVGATPAFRSSEPFESYIWESKTNQPLQQERVAFSAILKSFSESQITIAKSNSTYSDLVVGPQKDWSFPTTSQWIKVSELSDEQKKLVLNAIKTYVGDIANSEAILQKYESELVDTYIMYSGDPELLTKNWYIRIDGPSIWIEYSCQGGIIFSETHPHSVWRDKKTDYGGNK